MTLSVRIASLISRSARAGRWPVGRNYEGFCRRPQRPIFEMSSKLRLLTGVCWAMAISASLVRITAPMEAPFDAVTSRRGLNTLTGTNAEPESPVC